MQGGPLLSSSVEMATSGDAQCGCVAFRRLRAVDEMAADLVVGVRRWVKSGMLFVKLACQLSRNVECRPIRIRIWNPECRMQSSISGDIVPLKASRCEMSAVCEKPMDPSFDRNHQ